MSDLSASVTPAPERAGATSTQGEPAPPASGPSARTLTVAVLAGGRSSEHDVSLASGAAIREGLLAAGHEVVPVEIARDGTWRAGEEPVRVRPGEGLLGVDVVFPALHGPYGEDGTVQGLLETLDVAYVGAGVAASALCMDKVLFKRVLSATAGPGVPQVEYVGVREQRWRAAPARVLGEVAELGLPVFVKPAHLGSSVGIVKVTEPARMTDALEQALAHDELAIVEAMAVGVEVECGVLGLPLAERSAGASALAPALASEPGEVVFAGEFYDYAAKYTPGGMELVIPARISDTARARVRELAVETFVQVGCEGLARVDFFVDGESVVVNELNTMPGFTPTSVYAKLMSASGIPYPELLDRLCRLGIERHSERRGRRH
ncbi:MAG TPA: D-alanine--D-alanine ligase family protein [Solirubrobacteraceae bacterium]|nr:D-alanine--D-alanine ligase family protein [Solirubrobacteraceae bacterium]